MPIYADSEDKIGSRVYFHAKNVADALIFLTKLEPTIRPELEARTFRVQDLCSGSFDTTGQQ
jgi:hypothetical protein